MIESISAITLATHDMSRAVRFYRMLGFEIIHGGEDAAFTSFRAGTSYLNLIAQPAERKWSWWGRVIFYHSDVDALHARVVAAGYRPGTVPRDAEWGERFFHLTDPDGHDSALPGRCDEAPAPSTCRSKNASPCLTQKAHTGPWCQYRREARVRERHQHSVGGSSESA